MWASPEGCSWLSPEWVILIKEKVLQTKVATSFIDNFRSNKPTLQYFWSKTNPGMSWESAGMDRGRQPPWGHRKASCHKHGGGGGFESWVAAFIVLTSVRFCVSQRAGFHKFTVKLSIHFIKSFSFFHFAFLSPPLSVAVGHGSVMFLPVNWLSWFIKQMCVHCLEKPVGRSAPC